MDGVTKWPDDLFRPTDRPRARRKTQRAETPRRTGLAKLTGGSYTVGSRHIHLGKASNFVSRHHTNWRLCAIRAIEENRDQNLNYSSAVALSRDDAFKVREILLSAVKSSVDLIMKSPEEDAFVLNVDFVPLGKDRTV